MSTQNSLGCNSSNGAHGQPSIQKLALLLLIQLGLVLGRKGSPAKVSRIALSLHGGLDGGVGDDNVPETDPKEELVHGSLEEDVVRVHRLGHGFEAVRSSGETHKVGGDVAHDGQHGGAAMADFGLAEKGDEGFVRFGQAEGVELEFASLEVDASHIIVPHGVEGGAGLGHGGGGEGRGGGGEGEDGGDGLHGFRINFGGK